jgi:RNA polymerase sigma-70 factor (ECF subfamily)
MNASVERFMKMSTEFLLLGREAGSGRHDAFEQLMRRHNRTLFRTARAILGDDAEAEEAVQDACLRAYESLGDFRGEARLSTWLVRIAANEAFARRRKQKRRGALAPVVALDDVADLRTPSGPRDQAERNEIRSVIEAKIDSLPDAFRAVFVLRAIEELSVEETAAALAIPPATVRSRFFRARNRLREALCRMDFTLDEAFRFAGVRCNRIVVAVLDAVNTAAGTRAALASSNDRHPRNNNHGDRHVLIPDPFRPARRAPVVSGPQHAPAVGQRCRAARRP